MSLVLPGWYQHQLFTECYSTHFVEPNHILLCLIIDNYKWIYLSVNIIPSLWDLPASKSAHIMSGTPTRQTTTPTIWLTPYLTLRSRNDSNNTTGMVIQSNSWKRETEKKKHWNSMSTLLLQGLRGFCTPNHKLACFVLYHKIINTFLKNYICILKKIV